MKRRPRPFRPSGRLRHDTSGVVALEFALILPAMLILYLGGIVILNAIACNRKVTITARAVADLVSQSTVSSTTAAEVDSELSTASVILAPYSVTNATIRISEVTTCPNLKSYVIWSRGLVGGASGAALTPGTTVTLPSSMTVQGVYFIFSEISYNYSPAASFGFAVPNLLGDNVYMVPRNFTNIPCADCNAIPFDCSKAQ
ncbi:TadE/TadG family type IV pilus assembly protein [Gluconacetobacter takamatsuzukensis]|uniref:TadE/TadG family type IV pilus assembly protein n=1 Tax=Gluconacetobacter takamatsuzukensis TaxID=1286190 RepID=UPI0016007C93|nr:TadE/TadG family type IV pilus assembly protein [Gluconacetobacter takamatsuzukensis]